MHSGQPGAPGVLGVRRSRRGWVITGIWALAGRPPQSLPELDPPTEGTALCRPMRGPDLPQCSQGSLGNRKTMKLPTPTTVLHSQQKACVCVPLHVAEWSARV